MHFMRLWKAGLYTTIWRLGEGYPLSWCLSNREDQILLIYYFEYLKKTGTISPKWFISDDFDRFYKAWISAFNRHPQKKLFFGM